MQICNVGAAGSAESGSNFSLASITIVVNRTFTFHKGNLDYGVENIHKRSRKQQVSFCFGINIAGRIDCAKWAEKICSVINLFVGLYLGCFGNNKNVVRENWRNHGICGIIACVIKD